MASCISTLLVFPAPGGVGVMLRSGRTRKGCQCRQLAKGLHPAGSQGQMAIPSTVVLSPDCRLHSAEDH